MIHQLPTPAPQHLAAANIPCKRGFGADRLRGFVWHRLPVIKAMGHLPQMPPAMELSSMERFRGA
jgi:hypothetical protein